MKIAFFATQDTFIKPFVEHMKGLGHEVRTTQHALKPQMQEWLDWADVAWFEWCDDNIILASKLRKSCPVICRVHSYEVFNESTKQVKWGFVDKVVFVSDEVQRIFKKRVAKQPEMEIIHNGVDMEKFSIPEDKVYGKKIASIGYINYKKNPGLLLYAYQKILKKDPEFRLHLAGAHQDARISMYMDRYIARHNLPVIFEHWIDDIPTWLKDKDFVISTSYFESFHYSIAEGMASGVIPLIHDWPGSDALYPGEYLYGDPDECWELIEKHLKGDRAAEGLKCRKFIEQFYSAKEQLSKMEKLVDGMAKKPMKPAAKEYKDGITLCMVVCDEEVGVPRAIESVKDIIDDCVVCVDTKTEDKTAEVAAAAGATVFPYTWQDDFSAARNEAMTHVKTKWTLVLDGHEYLKENTERLVELTKEFPDAGAFFISVKMEDGQKHKSLRLHRTEGAEWRNAAHNILVVDGPLEKGHEVLIVHDRFTGQSQESRAKRNLQRDQHLLGTLLKKILDKPKDTRSMFYLAQQHRDAGRWEAAYYWYERYCRTKGGNQWDEELYMSILGGGRAAMKLRDTEHAITMADQGVRFMPQRAECWSLLGDAHYYSEGFEEAYKAFKRASECQVPAQAKLWVEAELHEGGWAILDRMAMCCWHLKRFEEGAELCKKILETGVPDQDRARVQENLMWHRQKMNLGSGGFCSADYWEKRYQNGGTSGAGSYGELANFKAAVVNDLIKDNNFTSVIDHGCGDGNQMEMIKCEKYIGLDVSAKAIEMCKAKGLDRGFYTYDEIPDYLKAEVGLSLDVVQHLVEDKVYETHMTKLFDMAEKCVVIYSTDDEKTDGVSLHMRLHKFTDWVKENRPEWDNVGIIKNAFPFDAADPKNTSTSDFYIFEKK